MREESLDLITTATGLYLLSNFILCIFQCHEYIMCDVGFTPGAYMLQKELHCKVKLVIFQQISRIDIILTKGVKKVVKTLSHMTNLLEND